MKIQCYTTERMVDIIYLLMVKGVKFNVTDYDSHYLIELTGGY